jgi:hypothetical protein
MAAAPFGQFPLDLFDQFAFLGMKLLLWKVPCLGYHESNIALKFV